MPNPKSGTVTNDLAEAIEAVKAGRIDFRVDKAGIVHTSIGNSTFSEDQIRDNADAFLKELIRLRPASAKGVYMKSVTLSTTMGPAVAIDRAAVASAARA